MAKHTLHVLELKKRIDNESKKIIRELHIKGSSLPYNTQKAIYADFVSFKIPLAEIDKFEEEDGTTNPLYILTPKKIIQSCETEAQFDDLLSSIPEDKFSIAVADKKSNIIKTLKFIIKKITSEQRVQITNVDLFQLLS